MRRNTPAYWQYWDPLIEAVQWFTGEKVVGYDPDILITGLNIPVWLAERMKSHHSAVKALNMGPWGFHANGNRR